MNIDFNDVMTLLTESEEKQLTRSTGNKDKSSIANYFTSRPKGIIIQDTYNNFAFPITPLPKIDKKGFDTQTVFKRYRELYTSFDTNMLPWHYVIEMVGNKYYALNTRPITMKYPLTNKRVLERQSKIDVKWDDITKEFFKDNLFDISEAIHVIMVGDSTLDVYPRQFYKCMGAFALRPIYHYFKFPDTLYSRTFPLNVGSKFNADFLSKFSRR